MPSGTILSLNVGRAGTLPWRGRRVKSAIDKAPVEGRVALGAHGFAGDEQADLRVHGGPDKAVCCYPSEHFPRWATLLERPAMPPGAFGENLTLAGLTEVGVHIGDTYTLGDAVVQVSQPRGPCFKLAARWRKTTLTREMARDMVAGFYLRVLAPGTVAAGDRMALTERVSDITVAEVLRVTYRDRHDPAALDRVVAVAELAEQWRGALAKLLERDALPLRDPLAGA
jgi:MOSC domain-containing protein YiiM